MRLAQLARKISIRQTDIVDFLTKSNVVVSNEANARLDDEQVKIILQHFAPSFLEQTIVDNEALVTENKTEEGIEVINPNAVVEENEIIAVTEPLEVFGLSTENPKEERIEVIKAPKADLPGLKVIGKIDLPEQKKKEILPVEENEKVEVVASNSEVDPKPRPLRTKNSDHNRRERNIRSMNPIALQRERDAREAEEKRTENAVKEKEKRTAYYQKRVKVNPPTKSARMFNEPVEEFVAQKREAPKTALGKLVRWFTNG